MTSKPDNVKVPTTWTAVLLGEFVQSEKGKKPTHESSEQSERFNIPYIDIEAFEEGRVKSWTDGAGCRFCDDADFLMVWDGARAGLVGKGAKGALGSTLVRIRFEGIDNDYAYYFLQSKYLEINKRAKGSGTPHVDPELLWSYIFPIAPLKEQHRIVAKLEELFSELDKAIECVTTTRQQLRAYRQSVLKHAFEGKFLGTTGGRNSLWQEQQLGELIEFLTSGSRGWADYYSEHGDLFIRAQNLKHDRLDLSEIAFVSLPEGKTEGVRTRVRRGDVLVTITGANVTKTGLVIRDLGTAYVSQHVALCRPAENLLPEFLYWYLLSETGGRRQLNEAAYGAGKPGLNLDNIRNVSIPLPSLAEQKAVISLITTSLEAESRLRSDVSTAYDKIHALRQSILKRAFSGELVAQDSSDEPASVLLDRIRAKQSDDGGKKRRSRKNDKREAA